MKCWPAPVLLLFLLSGCRNSHDYKENELYHDYRITAEEGAAQVSVLVQFKKRNSFGEAIELADGSSVEMDGHPLELIRQKLTDPIYVAAPALEGFAGKHQFSFTDLKGKQWKQDIEFPLFQVSEGPVSRVPGDNGSFVIPVQADTSLHSLRVMMIDTSYAGKEFNEVLPLVNGQLTIRPEEMSGLRSGPIQLELIAENHRRLSGSSKLRGAISASYTVRREFDWRIPDSSAQRH